LLNADEGRRKETDRPKRKSKTKDRKKGQRRGAQMEKTKDRKAKEKKGDCTSGFIFDFS
jgi:hypothetical protein